MCVQAWLFHVANEASKTISHDISSEAEFNCHEMKDVEDDGYDDCDDSVYLGGMLDKMAGECNIDRDEAVKRLGAVLQKTSEANSDCWKAGAHKQRGKRVALIMPNVGSSMQREP